jgi:cellulose synthase/poly-beta-1,6-N-acetylglucosamine synthase-like glycosyltransferase
MSRLVFWLSLATLGYTYLGFPFIVLARARLRPRPTAAAAIEPSVSIVMAARNEAVVLPARLDNLLALDYPADRLETIVASDGSDDATVTVAAGYADRGVRVLDLDRVGKADALNAAVGAARGEIVVFTDANTMFEAGALRALVAPFADRDVGGVAGDQRYLPAAGLADATGERSYWDFDRRLKIAESAAGSTVAATGAIYAIRRELFEPVRPGVTDDFITSTAVIARGRRLVFEPKARAWEPVAPSNRLEYGRKVRIMTRGLRGVALRRDLLDPRRTGFYAVQLASHKVLRRLMAFPLLAIAITAPLLWADGLLYRLATLGGVAVAALGTVGLAAPATRIGRHRLASLPAFFVLVNVASLHAAWNLATGRRIDRWEPRRGSADVADEAVDERAAGERRAIGGPARDPADENVAAVGR